MAITSRCFPRTHRHPLWTVVAATFVIGPVQAQLPTGANVVAGNATIATVGKNMTVTNSPNAILNWNSFSIGADAAVRFAQQSAASAVLNRVVGQDPSAILGQLTSNGRVFLINPNGIVFGQGARIDVAGLVASTLNLTDADFLANRLNFVGAPGFPTGTLLNQGQITTPSGGQVYLVGNSVSNEGIITSPKGEVILAAGNSATLVDTGTPNVSVTIAAAENQALNVGHIVTQGGSANIYGALVRNTGLISASSAVSEGGRVVLRASPQSTSAGFVALGGAVSADGVIGGRIEVAAGGDISLADSVTARGMAGSGGRVSYSAGGRLIETTTSHTDVSGQTDGGTIRAIADGGVLSSGQYSAAGAIGQGGRIDMSGDSVRLLSATFDAGGATMGGLVRIGGTFQGGKAPDTTGDTWQRYIGRFGAPSDLPTAQRTFINDSSRIDVSSRVGAGGTAILWSDEQITFLGRIAANGGAVEISSAGDLRYVNLDGLELGAGFLLLDPKGIVIGDFPAASTWAYQAILGKGYVSASKNIDVGGLEAGDQFGNGGLALNAAGDRLAVGSPYDAGNANSAANSGAVRLFSFTDTNFSGGVLQATLGKGYTGGKNIDVSTLDVNDTFGFGVAFNAAGDRLAVGSPGDAGSTNSAAYTGAVRLFSFTDSNFSGGALLATLGKGYTGGKDVNVSSLVAEDRFGSAVALNAIGDRLAAGAPWRGFDGFNSATAPGAVYLFGFADNSYAGGILEGTIGKGFVGGKNLDMIGLTSTSWFGASMALNAAGDRLAVGAPYGVGSAYLFSFTDQSFSGGTLQAKLGKGFTGGKNLDVTNVDAASNDSFGSSVALNAAGDRLAVSAYGDDGSGNSSTDTGAVYLFSYTDTSFSGGALQAIFGKGYSGGKNVDVSSLEASDNFGTAMAFNAAGTRLAVGANSDDGNGNIAATSGAVRLFSFTDTNFSGGRLQAIVGKGYNANRNVSVGGLDTSDQFGSGISLNAAGDRLAIGAYQDDGAGNSVNDSGAVRLFSFTDTNFSGGALQAMIGKGYSGGKNVDVSSLEAVDSFGNALSLNAAGDRLAVGAYRDDGSGNSVSDSGAVHLFSFTDTSFSGGALQSTLGKGYTGGKNVDVSSLEAVDYFGYSVALNAAGDGLAVGAVLDDGSANSTTNSGAVRLFSFTDTSFSGGALQATLGKGYTGSKNLDISGLETSDFFGGAVSLNGIGNRLAVGSYGDAGFVNTASQSGAVRLFSFTDSSFSGGVLEATLGKGYTGGKNMDVSSLQANDYFGTSVFLNAAGDRLAVGIYLDDGNANSVTDSGAVHLYSFTDTNFSGSALQAMIGKGYTGGKNVDISSLEANDGFGAAVALNGVGDRLAVAAIGDDGSGNNVAGSGAVHLFSFTDTNFSGGSRMGIIGAGYSGGKNVDGSDLDVNDGFGHSVALNATGDRLAVGAIKDDASGNSTANSGAVRLFSFADSNFSGGALQATLGKGYSGGKNVDVSSLEANDFFGSSVAFNSAGDRLAVGAFLDSGSSNSVTNSGAVNLFSFTDTSFSGGILQAMLGKGYTGGKNIDVSSLEANDYFGISVALNAAGDRLAVGAPKDDGSGNSVIDSGAVHLFSFTDTNFSGGTLQATLGRGYSSGKNIDVSSLEANDMFGSSVALNAAGNRLATGAYLDAGSGNSVSGSGAVHLFSFTDTNFSGGSLQAMLGKGYSGGKNLDVTGLEANDFFGQSVALNAAGDRLAVGAHGDDGAGNTASLSGAVRIFTFSDANFSGGALQTTIGKGYSGGKNLDLVALEANDEFGFSVALNSTGDRLAAGAYADSGSGNSAATSGAVYLFSSTPESSGTAGNVSYASNPGTTQNVDRSALQTLLSAGTSVTLQASNDITLNSGSNLIVNNPSGNGGQLSLSAGRSVLLNSSITTDSATLDVNANSALATGVVNADRDPGAASITMATGTTINTGTGLISIGIGTGAGLTNNTGGNISLENLTGGSVVLRNQGGGNITGNGTVTATSLDLSGAGVAATFTNAGNNVGTLSANVGSLAFVNSGALTVGSGTYATGITAGGAVNISALAGNLNVNQSISTTGNLTLAAGGNINAVATVGSNVFTLNGGTWNQLAATLPAFSASDFRVASGTFIRAVGGDGTAGTPYQLADIYGLQGMGSAGMLNQNFALANNIDATGTISWNSGTGFMPIGTSANNFSGSFDGLNRSIAGLFVDRPGTNYVGLVGYTASGSIVRNAGLAGGSVRGFGYVGALIGENHGSVSNSYATASVRGESDRVGGLVAINYGSISNSYATGTVSGRFDADGGLVGGNMIGGTITNSYATGTVSGFDTKGGLVGANVGGAISNSYATGSIGISGNVQVGGLAGYSSGIINDSYAAGAVSGSDRVGGLVGKNDTGGTISRSYAMGAVSGGGGLVGMNPDGPSAVTNGYWDTQTTGQSASAGGTGLTTTQMMAKASFAGWSIANTGGSGAVWRIYEGHGAPLLANLLTPLTLADVSTTYNAGIQNGSSTATSGVLGGASSGRNVGTYSSGYYSTQTGYDIIGGNLTISAMPITISGVTAADKVYDGTTAATLLGSPTVIPLSSDVVTVGGSGSGTFADAAVGTAKPVTVTGYTLSGADAGNYTAVQPTGLTADITQAIAIATSETAATQAQVIAATTAIAPAAIAPIPISTASTTSLSSAVTGSGSSTPATTSVSATSSPSTAPTSAPISGANTASEVTTVAPTVSSASSGADTPSGTTARPTAATSSPTTTSGSGASGATTGSTADSVGTSSSSSASSTSGTSSTAAGSSSVGTSETTGGSTSAPSADAASTDSSSANATSGGATTGSAANGVSASGSSTAGSASSDNSSSGSSSSSGAAAAKSEGKSESKSESASTTRAESREGAGRGAAASAAANVQSMTAALERRHEIKTAALTGAINALRENPGAADLPECGGSAGLCIAPPRRGERAPVVIPATARLPQIERKIAVVLGVEDYSGSIPSLKSPGKDIDAVSRAYGDKLGYEVRKLKNPSKADIVRELNRVIGEAHESDSVMIYYAGHGYVLDETKTGYWIPADGSAKNADNWISNRDVTRMLNNISAKQVMLVSDSCFSGKLAEGDTAGLSAAKAAPKDILQKRSVVVLSSGGDEPVADQGRDGHSIFAHHLLKSLDKLDGVTAGQDIFETVRSEVAKEFPQQPQYAPVSAAGHQTGGEFLFELRERSGGR